MAIILRKDVSENWFSNIQYPSTPSNSHQRDNDDKPHDFSSIVIHKGVSFSDNGEVYGFRKPHCHMGCLKIRYPKPMDAHHFPKLPFMGITPFQTHPDTFFIDCLRINLNFKSQLSRAKNLSPLPCRLDMLTLGLAHCLRAHNVILRDNNEKKLAYAELTHWEMSKK